MRRTKGSSTETPLSCPNIIKMYNASLGSVNVIDEKRLHIDQIVKKKFRFYLRIFFDPINIAVVNNQIVYTKLSNSIFLLDFKIVVAKSFIERYSNQQRSFFPLSRASKQKALGSSLPKEIPKHMLEFNEKPMQYNFCKMTELTIKNLYLIRPVVCTCAVQKREIAF